MPQGFDQSPFNDFEALVEKVDKHTIAIAFELIQGNSGIRIADIEFVKKVRSFCDEQGILLIIDEVQTGVARTGKFWCYEHYGILPDIIASAKALAGGIPIGAIIAKEEVAAVLGLANMAQLYGGKSICYRRRKCLLKNH